VTQPVVTGDADPLPQPEGSPVDDTPPATIQFVGAGKEFDDRWIVRDLDVDVPAGTILGLIGPSGCGKTTTVRMVTGVYHPDEGSVSVLGREPSRLMTKERVAIGYLPQTPVLFDELSLWENLNFHASLNGVRWRRRKRLRQLLDLVELSGEERKLIRDASGGMQRRLALAATLVHDPPVLVLDEPTAGIDPLLRRRLWDHFRTLRDVGRTIVVTTQHVDEAAHCDVVVVLVEGRVVAVGTPLELHHRAFGGDRLEILLGATVDERTMNVLRDIAGVRTVSIVEPRRLRIVVEDAATNLAHVLTSLDEASIDVEESREIPVDWDEAFIALVNDDAVLVNDESNP
jgi:ABC-2 type transport system ATP-binding protein